MATRRFPLALTATARNFALASVNGARQNTVLHLINSSSGPDFQPKESRPEEAVPNLGKVSQTLEATFSQLENSVIYAEYLLSKAYSNPKTTQGKSAVDKAGPKSETQAPGDNKSKVHPQQQPQGSKNKKHKKSESKEEAEFYDPKIAKNVYFLAKDESVVITQGELAVYMEVSRFLMGSG